MDQDADLGDFLTNSKPVTIDEALNEMGGKGLY